ncbi:MAG: glutamate racemase [Candidatus Melainabacteria bacterium]|nr:glutamate racemase [Candidatus Melainabacteria bacterium]
MTRKVTEDQLYKRTTKRIGLFDSGVGGLSVLRHLVTVTQGEGFEFVYLGDAARCPYGNRAKVEIAAFVDEIVSWLTSFQLDSIVMACNTSAAVAKEAALQAASGLPSLKVFDLIEPTAEWLVANPPKSIGVMSTINTANSQAFSKALISKGYQGAVQELGCPKLVPLIESGRLGEADCEAELRLALTEYLRILAGVDALVLGCTHFPFVADRIESIVSYELKELFPDGLKLIDPAHALAYQLLGYNAPPIAVPNTVLNTVLNTVPVAGLSSDCTRDVICDVASGLHTASVNDYRTDAFRFFTTGNVTDFAIAASRCLGAEIGTVEKLEVAELEAAPRQIFKPANVSIDVATSGSFA